MAKSADYQNPYVFVDDSDKDSKRHSPTYSSNLARYEADRMALIQALKTLLTIAKSGALAPAYPDEVFSDPVYVDKEMDAALHGYVRDIQRLSLNLSVSMTRCTASAPKKN